jgi:hypothetical protein
MKLKIKNNLIKVPDKTIKRMRIKIEIKNTNKFFYRMVKLKRKFNLTKS